MCSSDLMIEAGFIDPAKVVRGSLQDAASVAGLLITTEAGVAILQDEFPPGRETHSNGSASR